MARIPVLSILLLQLLCKLILVLGQFTPCPELTYMTNTSTQQRFAHFKINAPKNISELNLKVVLSDRGHIQLSEYQVKLVQLDTDVARAIQQGETLWYRLDFPSNKPSPLMSGIWLNGQRYCMGFARKAQVTTSIELLHKFVFIPYVSPVNNDICGKNIYDDINVTSLSKGANILPEQWPWLVAIFFIKFWPLGLKFQCAGNILTTRHVLTAAHCFKSEDNTNIPSSMMIASLGRYRLSNWNESGSVDRQIESYVLHPDYMHQESGDSDLAIFTLKEPVHFSSTIKPICLWSGSSDLRDITTISGYLVGWGWDEQDNPYLEEPRMARAPIMAPVDCHWNDRRLINFTSNRTFCAGLRDGSGPCNGDSGSGLMIYNTTTHRYHLRGILSRSLYNRGEDTCNLSQYVVYVDVTKYEEWILQQISNG